MLPLVCIRSSTIVSHPEAIMYIPWYGQAWTDGAVFSLITLVRSWPVYGNRHDVKSHKYTQMHGYEIMPDNHGNLRTYYSPRTTVSQQLLKILLASLWVFIVSLDRRSLFGICDSWLVAPPAIAWRNRSSPTEHLEVSQGKAQYQN
jgi:hypothetical protein